MPRVYSINLSLLYSGKDLLITPESRIKKHSNESKVWGKIQEKKHLEKPEIKCHQGLG